MVWRINGMVSLSSRGSDTAILTYYHQNDWFSGKANPSWQAMTSLTKQETVVLPTPKVTRKANPE